MDDGKDDAQYLVTCTYCGTQTRVNPRAVKGENLVTCRMCGAQLEIELPDSRERRVRKRSKIVKCEKCGALTEVRNTYYVDGVRYCARCNELLHAERRKRQEQAIGIIITIGMILVFIILGLLTGTCWTARQYVAAG